MNGLDLIARLLHLQSTSDGWSELYRDPTDGAFWEKTYPDGNYHGGGEPIYQQIDSQAAEQTYGQN